MRACDAINVRPLLPSNTVPTLVFHADRDRIAPPEEGRILAAEIPGARFVPLPTANHILLDEEPAWKIFREELSSFLKSNNANAGAAGNSSPRQTNLPSDSNFSLAGAPFLGGGLPRPLWVPSQFFFFTLPFFPVPRPHPPPPQTPQICSEPLAKDPPPRSMHPTPAAPPTPDSPAIPLASRAPG